MKKTKLIEILSTFSKDEIKEFEKFVASPFFSLGRDLKPFYKILKSYYPDFNNANFTYERIFKKLYPAEKYNKLKADNVLRVLSSDTVKLAEEFLIYGEFKSKKLRNRVSLLDILITRNLNKMFVKLYSETQKDYGKLIDGYTGFHFIDLYFLKMLEVIYKIHINDKVKDSLEGQIYLLNFFFLCAANFIDNSYKRKINYNIDTKNDLVEEFMRAFDFNKFISYLNKKKGIRKEDKEVFELCFYGLLHTLDRDNLTYVGKIEKLFYKTKHIFSDGIKIVFYFLLNAVYNKTFDFKKLDILYSNLLKEKIYRPEKGSEMPFMLYRVILSNFIELKKVAAAEKFTLEYTKYLNTDKKESFYNYSFALIEFAKGNFEKALDYISKVDMVFFYFKYDLKNLYLRIYYELNFEEEAYSMLDSYYHFLKSNKYVSDGQKIHNKMFADYFKKLISIKISGDKSELIKLKKNVSDEKKLFYKNWFLEKINELG